MERFYFTYGQEGYPFYGGWTVIEAPNEITARRMFRAYHPDRTPDLLNCAGVYDEFHFKASKMYKHGNFGYKCHEWIGFKEVKKC